MRVACYIFKEDRLRQLTSSLIVIFLFCFSSGCQRKAHESAAVARESEADPENFERVDPRELNCTLNFLFHRSAVRNGVSKPISGEVGEFICNGQSIELLSQKVEDGYILTKEWGKVGVRFSTSVSAMGFETTSIWLIPSQKAALREFTLSKTREQE